VRKLSGALALADGNRQLKLEDAMHEPTLIRDDDVAWEPYPALEGTVRIKRTISRERQGSELGMGVCELQPGQSTIWWSFIDGDSDSRVSMAFGASSHEAYFVLKGRFTFHWQDGTGVEQEREAGPGDSFYFAPGWRYRVENTGGTVAQFLWTMMPSAD
jgi:mannose-6-phosphate isomerase-like protein (cupin superfamily)